MKFIKYLSVAALAAVMASCSEEPVLPPVYQFTPNTTILEFKQRYWQDSSTDYVESVGLNDQDRLIVFKGRVISSDESNNIYKYIYVSDGTAAIALAVNRTQNYKYYPVGQEVLVNASYLNVGTYRGLMQLGSESTSGSSASITFMPQDSIAVHIHQTGGADPAKVQPIETDLTELNNALSNSESKMIWQGQLVKIDGLSFANPGKEFAPNKTNTSVDLKDAAGNKIVMRNSGSAQFATDKMPSGTGSVTAILSYYGSSWQLLLNDLGGLEGFDDIDNPDNPDVPAGDGDGTKEKPYTVGQLISLNNPGTTGQWVEGTIVGVMNYNEEAKANEFSATQLTTNSNIVIAATAEGFGTDIVAVQLPGGDIRSALNLVDHPDNLGKTVSLCGDLIKYCGVIGVKNTSAYTLDGQGSGDTPAPAGDPYVRATELVSGTAYVFWTDDKISKPMDYDNGWSWLNTADATLNADGTLTATAQNAYTFTRQEKGWTIQAPNGSYFYMDDQHNSFQLSTALDENNGTYFWNVTANADGRFEIVNSSTDKMVQYSSQFKSYGAYTDRTTGSLPYLYQSAK